MHMYEKITFKQYLELAKAVKEAYEKKVPVIIRNELINNFITD